MSIHAGLCTGDITITRQEEKIIIFECKESNWHYESKDISEVLRSMKPADFYGLYLRSAFENPNQWEVPATRHVIGIEQFIKEREKSNPLPVTESLIF